MHPINTLVLISPSVLRLENAVIVKVLFIAYQPSIVSFSVFNNLKIIYTPFLNKRNKWAAIGKEGKYDELFYVDIKWLNKLQVVEQRGAGFLLLDKGFSVIILVGKPKWTGLGMYTAGIAVATIVCYAGLNAATTVYLYECDGNTRVLNLSPT